MAGFPSGQRTCTETPRSDSEWLRSTYGAAGLSNPSSFVPQTQCDAISRFFAVSATGSFM